MFVLQIILLLIVYAAIGCFVLGLETGMDDITDTELLWYIVGWPIHYISKLAIILGKIPFNMGAWFHDKFKKEEE